MSNFECYPETAEHLRQYKYESFIELLHASRAAGLDAKTESLIGATLLEDLTDAYEDLQTVDESLRQFWGNREEAEVLVQVRNEHCNNPTVTLQRTVALARIKRFYFDYFPENSYSEDEWFDTIQAKAGLFSSWIDLLTSAPANQ